jgi:ATP-binding cassette subfamily F protein uup
MRNPNFWVLDEPTNDLDIVTLNILEEYLQSFKGCVIVVSHDRYFMDKVVDHLMVFKGNAELKDFPGNYTDFREWNDLIEEQEREELKAKNKELKSKAAENNQATKENKPVEKAKEAVNKLSFKEKKELEAIEKELPELETEKVMIENQLASGSLSSEEIIAASKRFSEIGELIDEKTMRWLELNP